MPKGIYPRGNKGGIKTEVADEMPRPEAANAQAVQVARQTDGEDEMSTSRRLFGDLEQQKVEAEQALDQQPIVQNPLAESGTEEPAEVKEGEDAPVPAQQQPEVKQPEPKEVPPSDEFLDLDKFGTKKVKAVIDGREENPTFKEVLGQYQLKKHLSEAADRVGEERRKLADERRQLQELRNQQVQAMQNVPRGTDEFANGQPAGVQPVPVDYLSQRVQFLEQQLNQVVEGTRPAMYESNRNRVAAELKGQGFNDFLDYIPKMESHIVKLQDPQLVQFYDTPMGAKSLYFQIKAQELSQPVAKPAPVQQRASAPAQEAPSTRIDSGSQPSGGMNDDGAFNYRKAFRRASTLGDDKEAWNDVLRQKGIIPD